MSLELLLIGLLGGIVLLILVPVAVGVGYALFAKSSPKLVNAPPNPAAEVAANSRLTLELSGPSLAVFRPGCGMRFLEVAIPDGTADIELSTRYLDGWGSVQDGLLVTARGSAQSVGQLKDSLERSFVELLSVLSLSANAWVGNVSTAGSPAPLPSAQALVRELDHDATASLMKGISGHRDAGQLWKALAWYRQALSLWGPQDRHLALARIHQGIIELPEVFVGFLSDAHGLSRSGLAKSLGAGSGDLADLVVKTEIYRGDGVCFHTAQLAWQSANSEESDLSTYSIDDMCLTSAARYFRQALFKVLELEEPFRSRLLAAPYDSPLGLGQTVYVSGEFSKKQRPATLVDREGTIGF